MTRRLAIILFGLLPGVALAETVQVRSGEHANFSRLVLAFDVMPEWVFGRVAGGYELRPTGADITYNLDRIYELIPRDRISDVRQTATGGLFLAVTCDCNAKVFEIRQKLVVDVRDGQSDAQSRFEVQLPETSPDMTAGNASDNGPAPIGESITTDLDALPVPDPSLPFAFDPSRTNLTWSNNLAVPPIRRSPTQENSASPNLAERTEAVAAAQSGLLQMIGRAAVEGLVVADIGTTEALIDNDPLPQSIVDPPAEKATSEAVPPNFASSSNIRFETAIDRGEARTKPVENLTAEGDRCLPSSKFNMSEWGEPLDQGPASFSHTSGIVGEFDAADPDSISAAAKHYIYLTFGAEARALLQAFDVEIPDRGILLALAQIVDEGRASAGTELSGQMECETAAALWSIVAAPSLPRSANFSRENVLSAFAQLPLHLRRRIGPMLVDRLLQVGDVDTASTVRNTISRAPGEHGDNVKMMTANIALEQGEDASGLVRLTEISETNGPLAPEAVVRLIEKQLADGNLADPEMLATATAMAFEARGTEMGTRLEAARLNALTSEGQLIEVLDGIDLAIMDFDLTSETAADLRQAVLESAAQTSSDALFLRVVFRELSAASPQLQDGTTRRQIAERLIDLGLYRTARDVLAGAPDVPEPDDRKLYARSHVGEGRADLAIGYLAGLSDDESVDLRAQSHVLAQEFDQAADIFEGLGANDDRARAAWRGQMWQEVMEIGSDAEREAAAVVTAARPELAGITTDPITLAQSENLLAQSRAARKILDALLTSTARP